MLQDLPTAHHMVDFLPLLEERSMHCDPSLSPVITNVRDYFSSFWRCGKESRTNLLNWYVDLLLNWRPQKLILEAHQQSCHSGMLHVYIVFMTETLTFNTYR